MKRLYVDDAVCEALVAYARTVPMGNGLHDGVALGPVNSQIQFDKVSRLVADGARQGLVLLGGAADEGLFFPVTLIADLPGVGEHYQAHLESTVQGETHDPISFSARVKVCAPPGIYCNT